MQQNGRGSLRAEQAARRGQGYQALSDLFTNGPTRQLARSLLDGSLAAVWRSGAKVANVLWAQPGLKRAGQRQVSLDDVTAGALWVNGAPESESIGALHEILMQEHRHLLVVPNPRYVPPYESAYRGPYALNAACQGLLRISDSNGTSCGASDGLQVEHFYTEAGWEVPEEWRVCPDHIGVELQFMAHLCALEADACHDRAVRAAESWRGWQRAFLRIHLGRWVPEFCARLTRAAGHPFYVIAAAATLHAVGSDFEEM